MTEQHRPLDARVMPRFSGVRTFARLPHTTDLARADVAALAGGAVLVPLAVGLHAVRHRHDLRRPVSLR